MVQVHAALFNSQLSSAAMRQYLKLPQQQLTVSLNGYATTALFYRATLVTSKEVLCTSPYGGI